MAPASPLSPPVSCATSGELARRLGHRGRDLGVAHPRLLARNFLRSSPSRIGPRMPRRHDLGEEGAELQDTLERVQQRVGPERGRLAGHLDAGLLHPLLEQELLHLRSLSVPLGPPLLHLKSAAAR